jgi:hypothetical protein
MNPPTRSFSLLAAACILSAAIGFYFGKLMSSPERAGDASPASSVKVAAEQRESPPEPVRVRDEAVVSAEPASVAEIIKNARASLPNGMDVSRLPEFVRALAPLAALDGAALRDAIDEVKRTVTDPGQKYALYSMLLGCLAERDGMAALAFAQAESQQPAMTGLDKRVLGVWARREPDAAWAWFLKEQAAGGETPDGGPERYLQSLFGALASSDVSAACARMRQLSPHDQFTAAQGMTGATPGDPQTRDALLAAAAGFDPDVRQMVYKNVVGNWVISDLDAATAWLETLPAADRKDATEKVGTIMLMVDSPRAAELLVRSAGDNYVSLGAAYSTIGTEWGSRNPRAAAEWINQQPPSKALDYARISFAAQFLDRDADAAFAWAKAITMEGQRYSMLQSMYEQLHKKDAPRAEQVLQSAGLPIEMVTKIRKSVAEK